MSAVAREKVFAIFAGGGVRGAAFAGALDEALKHVAILGVGGTSAGSMVAALYAAGYEPDEMLRLMLDTDVRKFARRFALGIPRRFGFHSSHPLYEWLSRKLSQKVHGNPHTRVCFGDAGLRCGIKIVAADIQHHTLKVFCKETDPSTEIAHAARLSMSIPFFYESIADLSGQYVDGGIISNFPVWLFDDERRQLGEDTRVLGFDLEHARRFPELNSWRSFASAVIATSLAEQQALMERFHEHPTSHAVRIDTAMIGSTDFALSPDQIKFLYQQGKVFTDRFFAHRLNRHAREPAGALVKSLADARAPGDIVKLLALAHLYSSREPADVGTFSRVAVQYHADFTEACLMPEPRAALARALVSHIRQADLPAVDVVAGTKRGNPMFALAVAEQLNAKPILVKDGINSGFGYPIEGLVRRGERALLVDDISSDGRLLTHAVNQLRLHGLNVSDVAVLMDRTEGNARAVLQALKCRLTPVCTVGDDTIHRWLQESKGLSKP